MKTKQQTGILLALLVLMALPLQAQIVTIQGSITDTSNQPLRGATVMVKNSFIGASANADGLYQLRVSNQDEITLVASFLGFQSVERRIQLAGLSELTANFQLEEDVLGLGDIVVTGVLNQQSKIESSISISTMDAESVSLSSPRTTAEIFRSIPGIRSEASAGEGNTNITVRGVPISAGGSKYLQLQEDGLPLLLFGDIAFATSDIFLRFDQSVSRIEALRGGSASTLASNSPAGIINFISKNGSISGGSASTSVGLDYNHFRTDFEYGTPLSDDIRFHIGGNFRQGEGQREAGFMANQGGQLRGNLTKMFESGYMRVYFKYLNDRTPAYMPMPMQVSGSNNSPNWESLPGFDVRSGSMHSVNLMHNLGTDTQGNLRRSSVSDGMNPVVSSYGTEFAFDLGDGWRVENRTRLANISGRFVSPFPAQIASGNDIAASIGGAGSSLVYSDNNANFGNALAMRIHMFDVELNDFNNLFSDTKINKSVSDQLNITAGFFKGFQNISMTWLWNSYLMNINGGNGRLLDVINSQGNNISENGLYAYGTPFWGNLHRNYDTNYEVSAPYLGVNYRVNDELTLDGSARWDIGRVRGSFANGVARTFDVNNDGVLSAPEQSVFFVDSASPTVVNYDYSYGSFSVGANYLLNRNQAVFARYSQGAAAKADRILFSGLPYSDGTRINVIDRINQAEVGYKNNFRNGGIFLTAFYAKTIEEGGFEATSQSIIENDYEAFGLELEANYRLNQFDLRSGVTYTAAEITSGGNSGNTPRRQPALMFNVLPSYAMGNHSFGLSILGQTSAYAQDSNELKMPGYLLINGFVNIAVSEALTFSVSGNNLTNTLAITESEEGSITNGQVNIVRARPAPGRSLLATVRYTF
jgi:outer membrane receptor protein involved in Fe transport